MRNAVTLAIVAALALGAGVMGTLTWVENRAASQRAAVTPTSAPGAEAASGPIEQPPAELTQGLSGAQATLALANWYYDHERWPQAIELYRSTLTSGIDNPNVRTDLGNALRFAGQPHEALAQYQIAQRQDPRHEQSLFNQGGLYALALNDEAKAVAAWRSYLKKFPAGQSAADARRFLQKFDAPKPPKK